MIGRVAALASAASLLSATTDAGAAAGQPAPTTPWVVAQLVPSPVFGFGPGDDGREAGRSFGLRWQLTPVLWSYGIHHDAPTRFRVFVVEPTMRTAGSIELHGSPEWLGAGGDRDRAGPWVAHVGARVYVPLYERGEGLAGSIGGGAWIDRTGAGPEAELGVYAFGGLLGPVVAWSPGLAAARVSILIRIRVL